jgi:small subunit ribosomal protein S6
MSTGRVRVRDYEAVYIFDSALEESVVNGKLDRYHGLVAGENGGQVAAVDHWGRRQLAYAIDDHENGYYVVTHFSTDATKLPEFERLLKLDEDLLRYLIVVNEGDLSTSPAPIVEERDAEDEDAEEEE